jgi:glucosylceramidase
MRTIVRDAATVALLLGLTAVPAAEASGRHDAPQARVWVTTPDRAELMAERPRVTFGTTPSAQRRS